MASIIGRPPRPENAPTGGYPASRPPRPDLGPTVTDEEVRASQTEGKLCARFSRRRNGLGSFLGSKELYYNLDDGECTLSWAKRPDENPKGTIHFKDIISVQSKLGTLENTMSSEACDQDSSDSACPLSRASSSSQRSLGARVRSLSPFRKLRTPEYEIVIAATGQQIELACDSKLQAAQWLSALEVIVAANRDSSLEIEQASVVQSVGAAQTSSEETPQEPSCNMLTTNVLRSIEGAELTGRAEPTCRESNASTACSSTAQSREQSQTRSSDPPPRERSETPPGAGIRSAGDMLMEDVDSFLRASEASIAVASSSRPHPRTCSPQGPQQPQVHSDSSAAKPQRSMSKGSAASSQGSGKQSRCKDDVTPRTDPRKDDVTPRCLQEAEEAETRRMFDKRELRRRNKDSFEKQLLAWRVKHPPGCQIRAGPAGLDKGRVRVCLRKRPLFAQEEENEFDSITVNGSEVVVHNCQTKADLKTLFVSNMGFHFGSAFGERSNDTEVYKQCAEPAIQYALQGGSATIFMFGQTGSGKTHTMQALTRQASAALFADAGFDKAFVGALEIAGRTLKDLQDPGNPDKGLKVVSDLSAGQAHPGQVDEQDSCKMGTQVQGLKWTTAESSEDLLKLCQDIQERRTTRATQANSVSSRSHSIVRIGRSEEDILLTLVDCAGSERNEDSTHHSAQDRKDAADINSSIFALKECFRALCEGKQQPPFRNNVLTRVLADSFTSDKSKFVAIGTVSPSSRDTEHSIETMRSLQMLQGTHMTFENKEEIKAECGPIVKHPRAWSVSEVRSWLEDAVEGRAASWVSGLPKDTDGKMFARMPAVRFAQLCGNCKDLGDRIYTELHQEMRRADDSRKRRA